MPAPRNISTRQFELLVEYADDHRDVALGRLPGGPQGQQRMRIAWNDVAIQLNSVANGVTKTGEQWRRYWIELKARTKAKAAKRKQAAERTGAGAQRPISMCPLEERILHIIGPTTVNGIEGVIIPLHIPSTPTESYNLTPAPAPTPQAPSSSPAMQYQDNIESPTFTLPSTSTSSVPIQSPQLFQNESRVRERSPLRRRAPRRIREPNVPSWAYAIEESRLAVERENAAALRQIGTILDQRLGAIERAVASIADSLNRIHN